MILFLKTFYIALTLISLSTVVGSLSNILIIMFRFMFQTLNNPEIIKNLPVFIIVLLSSSVLFFVFHNTVKMLLKVEEV